MKCGCEEIGYGLTSWSIYCCSWLKISELHVINMMEDRTIQKGEK